MQRPNPQEIPTTPGVYLYKDKTNRIIYVGKALNLRKRVLSYFRDEKALTPKTVLMISHAVSIDTISTSTEKEALLLEASLIKKHKPRYNIVLRDDKQYVLFKLSAKETFPRLEITRSVKKDGSKYYGPYTSGLSARETWKSIHRTFPLRRCSDKSFKNRVRPCLYYHIGQCLAPCTQEVEPAEYAAQVYKVQLLLSGKSQELLDMLKKSMFEASDNLDFERAANLRDQVRSVEKTLEKQSTVLPQGGDIDAIGIVEDSTGLSLGIIFIRNGVMIDTRTFHWQGLSFEESNELLLSFLAQYYSSAYIPLRILLPFLPEQYDDETEEIVYEEENPLVILSATLTEIRTANLYEQNGNAKNNSPQVRLTLPKSAEEGRLIEIAQSNAREAARTRKEPHLGVKLSQIFNTKQAINRIECVDVSHTSGTSTKVGVVVFEEGKPLKSDYRVWNINAEGDDYAALATWAERRIEHGEPFPDLLLIDGGKGQLSVVQKALLDAWLKTDNIMGSSLLPLPFLLASIAKARDEDGKTDRRAGNISDRIFIPNRLNPLNLHPGSVELLYLQKIRDAAHHFSIGKHREARTKAALISELERIEGIGTKTAQLLWSHFNSIDAMTKASVEDLKKIPSISEKKAILLHERLKGLT